MRLRGSGRGRIGGGLDSRWRRSGLRGLCLGGGCQVSLGPVSPSMSGNNTGYAAPYGASPYAGSPYAGNPLTDFDFGWLWQELGIAELRR